MADMAHYCSACGEVHGGHSGDSEAVRVAKIQADRDIEVARIQRSEARQAIEAETEQTEIESEAAVEAAVAEAVTTTAVLAATAEEAPSEPAPEAPVAEEAPAVVEEVSDGEPPAPPETEKRAPAKSGGYWGAYAAS